MLSGSSATAAVTFINTCGFVIKSAGQYHLAQDLNCTAMNGIIITASDVELHLDGHTLTGDGTFNGIFFEGLQNVSIFGSGVISNFTSGIYVVNCQNVKIVNVTATDNLSTGIYMEDDIGLGDANNTLISNTASRNGSTGIQMIKVWGSILLSNQTDGNANGIQISSGKDNLIQANSAHYNTVDDLYDDSCGSNTWKSNQFKTANAACIQ